MIEREGLVPTCWLLCGFLSPEIITDTSIWSSTLCLPLLDQMLIRGNPCFALYLLLAIFKENEQILLKAKTVEDLEDCILNLPWSIETNEINSLFDTAYVMEYLTPVSTSYCLLCAFNQCSSDLLPDALPGTVALWEKRYHEFSSHMLLSKEDPLLNEFHRFDNAESYLEIYSLQQTAVYRVLSRDLFYLPFPTMCSLQVNFSHFLLY